MMTTNKTQKGRVFSYARWSSEPQSAGDSERRQIELAKAWCRRNGRVLEEQQYTDRGISGWRGKNRTEGALAALLRVVGPGDTILIEDNDRFSRERPLDSLNALREVVGRDVEVVFLKTGITVNKNNFDDPTILFPNFFQSFLANSENEKKSMRVREAMAARRKLMESGIPVPGRLPSWLDWDRNRGKPVINQAKVKVIKRIFDMCISGMGLTRIEHALQTSPTITGRDTYIKQKSAWNSFYLHRLLTDRTVLGYQRSSGLKLYPAIIDDETFYKAVAKLKARKKLTVRVKCQNSSLFTSLVRCGKCGATYVRQRAISKGKSYDYLLCSGYLHQTTPCKTAQAVNYIRLENSFLTLIGNSRFFGLALFGNTGPSKIDALTGELEDIQRQIKKYMSLIENDDYPSQRLVQNLKLLESKEARLDKELQMAQAEAATTMPADQAIDQFKTYLANDPENRCRLREIMRDFVEKIIITKGGRDSEYEVYLKAAKRPVAVLLRQNGWSFLGLDYLPGNIPSPHDQRLGK